LGLERDITETGFPRTQTTHFFTGASLTAPGFGRVAAPPASDENSASPTAVLACPQDQLEHCYA
ncbi:MAG: hypothetical protein ACRDOD_20415, partial [Streptosporangiaceae bacterium]